MFCIFFDVVFLSFICCLCHFDELSVVVRFRLLASSVVDDETCFRRLAVESHALLLEDVSYGLLYTFFVFSRCKNNIIFLHGIVKTKKYFFLKKVFFCCSSGSPFNTARL